ncbi:flagellar hook-associated protein FlgL [Alkalihalobacillus oceani]|uniref:Flagellar hook-associated protein FlgL n=1 Tax=Halalkalibacter oceani TaxID=1653776 RepID=A0A9X2DV65_9BACI|nr:flagellar hook-associated protein FlgL [Halalkalibacter oceani]MCM3716127.1 flagellar hook-associated protein FlgL [Halalkalibacter oceani]
MRVTQMMLSTNSLRHINQGYNRLASLQDQLSTGKKITRPSQDPVVAMKGMRYRTQVTEVEQFKRNLSEAYNWLDTADAALDQATETLRRIRDLSTQAANDSYNAEERANIAKEVQQLREHLQSLANTKSSHRYIFNGTDTTNAPIIDMEKIDIGLETLFDPNTELDKIELSYDGKIFKEVSSDGGQIVFEAVGQEDVQLIIEENGNKVTFTRPNPDSSVSEPTITETLRPADVIASYNDAVSINTQTVEIELLKGVTIPVNVDPANIFNNALFGDIIRLEHALNDPGVTGNDLTGYIDNVFGHIDQFVAERAELGARVNRVEMMESRLMEQEVSAKNIMSNNEDADIEQVIIDLTIQESVHRAALAVGARIIQPTLLDFLR